MGVWGNARVPMTVRVDAKLKVAVKRYLVRKFGSTCRGVEAVFVALLKADEVQQRLAVYREPNTNINFEKVVVERNVRTRRKLVVEEREVTRKYVVCTYCDCEAVGSATYKDGVEYALCAFHLNELAGKDARWRVSV